MKNIVVVATGGTIAGVGEKGKTVAYHAGEISVNDILSSIPDVKQLANTSISYISSIILIVFRL